MAAVEWQAAIGEYPHTQALKSGQVTSKALRLTFADITPINRAFKPMVRESRFDVSELAIATFLQAKACGKPLVLLPITMAARFQQAALLRLADSNIAGPADLAGRCVGVRAYGQTTGMWLRGILADEYGVSPDAIRWTTFEDEHVAEMRVPPFVARAAPGADLLGMLRARELEAIIVGNDVPEGADLRPVFADVEASSQRFWERHGFVPVNHLVTVRREHAETQPELIVEMMRMFRASKDAMGPTSRPDPYLIGRDALQPAINVVLRYCEQQGLLPRKLSSAEVWDGLPEEAS
jgi:4,5-dihydroxyphthalate decarboxylase